MRRCVCILLIILIVPFCDPVRAAAAERGGKAEYVGGTLETLRNGQDGVLDTTDKGALLFISGKTSLHVPYHRINLLEYGQRVSRRVAMAILISPLFLMSKSRKHFLTLSYQDEHGQQQALVFRLGKDHVRPVLAGLEARTGLRVDYQDEEARKAGRG